MDEYIRRDAAKKEMGRFIGYAGIDEDMVARFRIALDRLPAADVVPVVHCIDCVHLGFKDFHGICEHGPVCTMIEPDSYCAWGRKKEDQTCG